jgi:hypothetical protein
MSEASTTAPVVGPSPLPEPEVKVYPDAVYYNYHALGLSLMYVNKDGSRLAPSSKSGSVTAKREDVREDTLILDSIDVYNVVGEQSKEGRVPYSPFPAHSIMIPLSAGVQSGLPEATESTASAPRASQMVVKPTTTGREFVEGIGEPTRKGGGSGPSSGSIGIWCEWKDDGIMVEFGGAESRGIQAWERGKDAVWKVLTMFRIN